jgi:hypothetical protein
MNDPDPVEEYRRNPRAYYTTPGQFRAAGTAKCSARESDRFEYAVTGINDHCFSILSMSDKEWPGGLRWLRGENEGGGKAADSPDASDRTPSATPPGE